MALKMNVHDTDGVSVVALDGRVVLGEESNALREQVKNMLASGKTKIVLNMENVTYIDSAGLGTLVAAHHSARTQGAFAKTFQSGQAIPGDPAGHETADGFRGVRHRGCRHAQLQPGVTFREAKRSSSRTAYVDGAGVQARPSGSVKLFSHPAVPYDRA